MQIISLNTLDHWQAGVGQFNDEKFWESHVSWEHGWRELPAPYRLQIQACIQTAAVFHLLGIGRGEPALRLCALALQKFQPRPDSGPWVQILGARAALLALRGDPGSFQVVGSAVRAEFTP